MSNPWDSFFTPDPKRSNPWDAFFRPKHDPLEHGNIDLYTRPHVKNPDGSVSTVRSMSFGENGREILVPTVSDDGRILSNEEAIDAFHRTGKHLGIFDTPDAATAYAKALHDDYAAGKYDKPHRDMSQLGAELRAAGAEPGLGQVDFDHVYHPDSTLGRAIDAAAEFGTPPAIRLLEHLGVTPEGTGKADIKRAADAGAGWLVGGAERVGIAPAGTRQGMKQSLEAERENLLMRSKHPELTALMLGGSELAGGVAGSLIPGTSAAGLVGRLATKAGPRAGAAMRIGAGAAEGGVQGFSDSAGASPEEQLTSTLLGAGLGILGGAHAAASLLPKGSALTRPLFGKAIHAPVVDITPRGPESGGLSDLQTSGIADALAAENVPRFTSARDLHTQAINTLPDHQVSALRDAGVIDDGDPLTGFLSGRTRAATVQRAIDHVEQHDVPGTYAEIDIRNLGGGNAALGHSGMNKVIPKISGIVEEEVHNVLGAHDSVDFIRHGGDELSVLAVGPGASRGAIEAALARAQERVKAVIDEAGIGDIANPKRPEDPGMGIHYATSPLGEGGTVDSILHEADTLVEARKHGAPYVDREALGPNRTLPLGEQAGGVEGRTLAPGVEDRSGYGGAGAPPQTPLGHPPGRGPAPPLVGDPARFEKYVNRRPAEDGANLSDRLSDAGQYAYRQIVSSDQPIERAAKIAKDDRLLSLLSTSRGAAEAARSPLVDQTRLFDSKSGNFVPTGESLRDILKGATPNEMGALEDFMAGERQVELAGRKLAGEKLKIDDQATADAAAKVQQVALQHGPRIEALAGRVRDWTTRALLDPLREVGYLSGDRYHQVITSNEKYTPYFRLLDELDDHVAAASGGDKAQLVKISEGLSQGKPIAPPLESLVNKVQSTQRWIAKQRVKNQLANAIDSSPELRADLAKPSEANLLRGRTKFTAMRDGKRVDYNVPRDLFDALDSGSPKQANVILRVANFFTKTLRAALTLAPDFALRNPLRDQMMAGVFSEHGYVPFLDGLKGLAHVLGRTEEYKAWVASGGAMSTMQALDRPHAQSTLASVARPATASGALAEFGRNWKREGALYPLQLLSETLESSTRVGAFAKALKKGAPSIDAARESREVTLDFARSGVAGSVFNSLKAFANAEIQDIDKFARAMKSRPGPTSAKALAYITLPAVANWYLRKDDPTFKNLPLWDRTLFFHPVKFDDGSYLRIPRPQGLVTFAFGNTVENFLEYLHSKKPAAAADFAKAMLDAADAQTPLHYRHPADWAPTALEPALEVSSGPAGFDNFRQKPIVPMGEQRLLPGEQGSDTTSPTARMVGRATGTSPFKVEHLIRGYLGTLGRYGLEASDATLRAAGAAKDLPEREKGPADYPVARAFVSRAPVGFSSQPVQDLLELNQNASQAKTTIEKLRDSRDFAGFLRVQNEHPEARFSSGIRDVSERLFELQKARHQVMLDPRLSKAEREDQLRRIDGYVTQIAGAAMLRFSQSIQQAAEKRVP